MLSIIVLSFGNGCLKPCILAFGADQYQIPEQTEQMNRYFAHFYLVLKISGVASSLLTPVVRSDIPSVGPANGYLLAFVLILGMNVGALGMVNTYIKHTNILTNSSIIFSSVSGRHSVLQKDTSCKEHDSTSSEVHRSE